ncbi:MAG: AEC family transporter [Rhodobacteraceae bacterium]|nr:AEC family transporter [Paracoccaceae bacterium]
MVEVFLKTLPFFALIALGYLAGRTKFFSEEATGYLTKFVFYFALSAMLFRFSATLDVADVFSWPFVFAYLWGTLLVYLLATALGFLRGAKVEEIAVEAQVAVIGNVGFLGIPMLVLLLGDQAIGPVMMVLAVDLIFFGSLIVILITGSRDGRMSLGILRTVGIGLISNPMIVSMSLGLLWAATGFPIPGPLEETVSILGSAATPGALFAIGASLASKAVSKLAVTGYLSFFKLVVHPAAVAYAALVLFEVEPYAAGVMIAAASLPVAGNVFILAQHYGVAPARVSASILISTAISVVTVSLVIGWVATFAL